MSETCPKIPWRVLAFSRLNTLAHGTGKTSGTARPFASPRTLEACKQLTPGGGDCSDGRVEVSTVEVRTPGSEMEVGLYQPRKHEFRYRLSVRRAVEPEREGT